MNTIRDGGYQVGSLLPTENELSELYGVSRHTVREAIKQLQTQGMVSRRAGVGTRIEAPESSMGYRQSLSSIDDLVQFGKTHVRVVERLKDVVMDIPTAKELECTPGTRWMWIGTVRIDQERKTPKVICWTDNYVDPLYKDIGAVVRDCPRTLICSLIEQRYQRRTVKVTQTVGATTMPAQAAKALNVEPGSPALLVIRHYFDELDDAFIVTRTLHPGYEYKLRSILYRDM